MRRNKAILIVGVGGLGIPAAIAIARNKAIVRIGLIEPDRVELTNLHRQVIYTDDDIGHLKVEAAATRLRDLDDSLLVETFPITLDTHNARGFFERYDFVIDGTDSPVAKFLINDVSIATGTPFAYGGVLGMRGQAMTVMPGRTACLRCLFEQAPDPNEVASCREAGILGPVAGAIGCLQAREALAVVAGREADLANGILSYDAMGTTRVRFARVSPRQGCACGAFERQSSGPTAAHIQVNN